MARNVRTHEAITRVLAATELDCIVGGDGKPAGKAPVALKEEVAFEYGGLVIQYVQQSP